MTRARTGFILCLLASAACSDTSAPPGTDTDPGGSMDLGQAGPDLAAPLPPGTRSLRLVSSQYDIVAGTEGYQCQRVTIPKDMYILSITPVSPTGVHHEVLSIDPTGQPDGKSPCGPLDPQWQTLFASGVGSPALQMPKVVALKVAGGSQVVLDLHLYNAHPSGSQDITGEAAIDVVVADSNDGYQIAAVPFVGPLSFTIGPSAKVSGTCTVSNDTSFFAVFPHMHKTGKHIKISAGPIGSDTVVWDNDYNFDEQTFGIYPKWLGPPAVSLKKGDHINVTCTYTPDGVGKVFGQSTDDEMCFAISYVTPAINTFKGSPFCVL